MAMRSQVYAWDLYGGKSNTSSGAAGLIQATFTGGIPGVGNTLATMSGTEYVYNLGGSGYAVNDVINFVGNGVMTVTTIGAGGVIEDATIDVPGGGYVIGQKLVVDSVVPAGGTGLDLDLGAIGTGFTAGIDNATTTVVSATGATGGTIQVASVTPRGAATSMTSNSNAEPGTGTNYVVGDTFITGGANGLAGTVTQTGIGWSTTGNSNVVELGKPFSIFIGGKGNNISIPAATSATQFVVVENFGCSPSAFLPGSSAASGTWIVGQAYRGKQVTSSVAGPRAYLQFTINTTGYFKDPDGVVRDGIPGTAAPYPVTEQFNACADRKQPSVYVLPGQKWDLQMVIYSGVSTPSTGIVGKNTGYATAYGQLTAFFKYTLYDGADALIAMKMLEMGIKITPQNIDKYKQSLVDNQNKQYVMEKDE